MMQVADRFSFGNTAAMFHNTTHRLSLQVNIPRDRALLNKSPKLATKSVDKISQVRPRHLNS